MVGDTKPAFLAGVSPATYERVRGNTEKLCAPLETEDFVVQSMEDVSPAKWHLAHTTWFFEQFILTPFADDWEDFHPQFSHLFNSYYQQVGAIHQRNLRGSLSRPTVEEVFRYRQAVDHGILELLRELGSEPRSDEVLRRLHLGLQHEEQHQELLLMDIKHVFAASPLHLVYRSSTPLETRDMVPLQMLPFEGGIFDIGLDNAVRRGAYDNEGPRHQVVLRDFALANRCVTNGDYVQFIEAKGYEDVSLWLADGWEAVHKGNWCAPLYWKRDGASWLEFRLAGLQPIDESAPVVHLSFYEADAFARWAGKRLPSEFEWEVAARGVACEGHFASEGLFHPRPARGQGLMQMFGDVWEHTMSSYSPYPRYRSEEGPLGEYNGKFMSGQMVCRGGSCLTPPGHVRPTYRNFFQPQKRWPALGMRLADDSS